MRHGGSIIAETLQQHDVEFIFTLCGGHISPILVACREKGAIQILEFLKEKNIDGVEIKTTDCAFMCSVAPAVSVGHTWYGRQVPDNSLAELIEG